VSINGKMVKAVPAKATLAKRCEQIRIAHHAHYKARKMLRTMRDELVAAKADAYRAINDAKDSVTEARLHLLLAKIDVMRTKRSIRQAKCQ